MKYSCNSAETSRYTREALKRFEGLLRLSSFQVTCFLICFRVVFTANANANLLGC